MKRLLCLCALSTAALLTLAALAWAPPGRGGFRPPPAGDFRPPPGGGFRPPPGGGGVRPPGGGGVHPPGGGFHHIPPPPPPRPTPASIRQSVQGTLRSTPHQALLTLIEH